MRPGEPVGAVGGPGLLLFWIAQLVPVLADAGRCYSSAARFPQSAKWRGLPETWSGCSGTVLWFWPRLRTSTVSTTTSTALRWTTSWSLVLSGGAVESVCFNPEVAFGMNFVSIYLDLAALLAAAAGKFLVRAAGVGAGFWMGGIGFALASVSPRKELRLHAAGLFAKMLYFNGPSSQFALVFMLLSMVLPFICCLAGLPLRRSLAAVFGELLLRNGRCQSGSSGRGAGRPATGRTGQCEATSRLSLQMSEPCPTCTLQSGPHRM